MTCILRLFDSHRSTRCSPFWLFNHFKYLPVQFSSCLLAGKIFIHISTALGLIVVFLNQVFHFFVEILPFVFCLVNSECGAYLAVDHSLLYSYPKIYILFFRLILDLIPGLKSSFSIHISVLLCLTFCF